MNQFFESLPEGFFEEIDTDTIEMRITQTNTAFKSFFKRFLEGKDQPSKVAAIHIKEMESYWTARKGVACQDFWVVEAMVNAWIAAYFIVKKKNYVVESCSRIDTLYG